MNKEINKDANNNGTEITLKDVFTVFIKNLKLFFVVAATTFVVLIVIFLFFLTPVFEVNASLEIRSQTAPPVSLNPMALLMGSAPMADRSMDFELLKSRRIIDSVIEKNNLQMKITRKRNNMFSYFIERITGSSRSDSFLMFRKYPEALMSENGKIFVKDDGYTIVFNGKKADCKWNADCSFMDGVAHIDTLGKMNTGDVFKFEFEHILDARERVRGNLSIGKADESDMVRLGFVHESPLVAERVLNDIVSAFIGVKKLWEDQDTESKKQYINAALEDLSSDLNEKSERLILFQQEEKTLIPELEVTELLKKQELMKVQIEELRLKKNIIVVAYENIERSPDTPITIPMIFDSLSTQEALKYHNSLIFKRNELSQKVTPIHPSVVNLEKEISESAESLKKMLGDSIAQFDRGIKMISDLLSMIATSQGKIPETLFTFARLRRDVELAERVFVTLSAKLYESAIDSNVGLSPVRVIDYPDPVVMRSFPKARVFAIVIFILTFFSGFLAIFLKEFSKAIVKSLS